MNVEKFSDELWIGVKGQSNVVIAGSLRNSLRASVGQVLPGGRALDGLGTPPGYQNQSNSEFPGSQYPSIQAAGAKLRRREGNSPDRQLRCQNAVQWKGCDVAQTVRMLA